METKIKLINIQLYGMHGVDKVEKQNGQQFEIDVEVLISQDIIIEADDITKTVNYCDLYEYIVHLFSEKEYNLIETLANKISMSILQKFNVLRCKVLIRKPNAPIKGVLDAVEVEVSNNV
jgi:dihydroneopterin aldolase